MPQLEIPLFLLLISSTILGMRETVLAGAAGPAKNAPSFLPFSSLSGGYQEISAGLPSKKSGMKTWYLRSLSEVARISAPWRVWGKKPKMSKTIRMACLASAGPVRSGGVAS